MFVHPIIAIAVLEINIYCVFVLFIGKSEHGIPERDLTLAEIYGTLAVLILKPTSTRLVEVIIYLLNGPGLAPQKSHILQLGHSGRFAMNIVDDLIVVHHQVDQLFIPFLNVKLSFFILLGISHIIVVRYRIERNCKYERSNVSHANHIRTTN